MTTTPQTVVDDKNDGVLFACGMVQASQKHVAFLRAMHDQGWTMLSPQLRMEAIRRYRQCWLPLVAAAAATTNQQQELIPPPDIAWVWHCHRLAPRQYMAYCRRHYSNTVLDAHPPFAYQQKSILLNNGMMIGEGGDKAQRMWKITYGAKEPFFLNTTNNAKKANNRTTTSDDSSLLSQDEIASFDGWNLLESMQRQSTFLWHIANIADLQDAANTAKVPSTNYESSRKLLSPPSSSKRTIRIDGTHASAAETTKAKTYWRAKIYFFSRGAHTHVERTDSMHQCSKSLQRPE